MADEPPLRVVPLSRGIRKTHSEADPFVSQSGEAKEAQCGTFTLEGGFREHGGISQYTNAAAGGGIVWMKRWYKPDRTKYFLALSKDGTLHLVNDAQPATLTTLYTGLSGEPFSSAEMNGWIYLGNGIDPLLRYDGTNVFQVGAEAPVVGSMSATEDVGAGSLDVGTYLFKVTYEYGHEGVLGESNAMSGTVSVTTVSANGAVILDDIPVSARDDVKFKDIYRTLVDENIYYWIARIPADQTTYTVSDADTFLSSANYQMEENHDIPPKLGNLAVFRGRVFGEDPNVPGRVRFTMVDGSDVFPDDPEYYSDELAQDGEILVKMFRFGEGLFAAKKTKTWVLTGDTNANFLWDEVPGGTGFASSQSVARGEGAVFGLGSKDVSVFNGVATRHLREIRGLVDLIDELNKDTAIGVYRGRKYYLAVQTGSDVRPALIIVIHHDPLPEGGGFEASTISRTYTSGGATKKLEVNSFAVWENENDRFFMGCFDGYIYEFDQGNQWNRVGEDATNSDYKWISNWLWGQGPAQRERYEKAYLMIESEGGVVDFEYEIMTDDPNTTSSGSQTVAMDPDDTSATDLVGRWNHSRWG